MRAQLGYYLDVVDVANGSSLGGSGGGVGMRGRVRDVHDLDVWIVLVSEVDDGVV